MPSKRSFPVVLTLLATGCGSGLHEAPVERRNRPLPAGACLIDLDPSSRTRQAVLRITFKPAPTQGGLVLTLKADPDRFRWEPIQEYHPGYTVVAVSGAGPGELLVCLFVNDPATANPPPMEAVCFVGFEMKASALPTSGTLFPLEVTRAKIMRRGSNPGNLFDLPDASLLRGNLRLP